MLLLLLLGADYLRGCGVLVECKGVTAATGATIRVALPTRILLKFGPLLGLLFSCDVINVLPGRLVRVVWVKVVTGVLQEFLLTDQSDNLVVVD